MFILSVYVWLLSHKEQTNIEGGLNQVKYYPEFPGSRKWADLNCLFCCCCFSGRLNNCSHPLVPEHGGFRCDPSPCRGFPLKSSIRFFCEPGYHISNKVTPVSRCHRGRWSPPIPKCIKGTKTNKKKTGCIRTKTGLGPGRLSFKGWVASVWKV